MEKLSDSDLTMLAATSFNGILNLIQNSCLNFQVQLSPYSALISLKKSFVKDKEGSLILPKTSGVAVGPGFFCEENN